MFKKVLVLGSLVIFSLVIDGITVLQIMGGEAAKGKSEVYKKVAAERTNVSQKPTIKFANVNVQKLKVAKVERLTFDAHKLTYDVDGIKRRATYSFPQWSSDGEKIAFTANVGFSRGGFLGIWIMDVNGNNKRKLTNEGGYNFVWASDSKRIVFSFGKTLKTIQCENKKVDQVVTTKVKKYPTSIIKQSSGNIISVIDNKIINLIQDKVTGRLNVCPIGSSSSREKTIYTMDSKIWVVDANGSNKKLLIKEGIDPIVSPDGKKVCYQGGKTGHIGILWIDGSKHFAPPLLFPYYASWSHDGSKIVINEVRVEEQIREGYGIKLVTGELMDADLYVGNADNTGWKALTDTKDESELYPDWSPDGSKIIYVSGKTGDLYVITLGIE